MFEEVIIFYFANVIIDPFRFKLFLKNHMGKIYVFFLKKFDFFFGKFSSEMEKMYLHSNDKGLRSTQLLLKC